MHIFGKLFYTYYPFTEPAVTPPIIRFENKANAINIGTTERAIAIYAAEKSVLYTPFALATRIGTV